MSNSLPSGYTEVQYLESYASYNDYITISGIFLEGRYTKLELEVMPLEKLSFERGFVSLVDNFLYIIPNTFSLGTSSGVFAAFPQNPNIVSEIDEYNIDKKYTIEMTGEEVYINGVKKINITGTTKKLNSLFLFKLTNANSTCSSCRIYSCKIYDLKNNVLNNNLVPCIRDSDSKCGVYDTVKDKFYTSEAGKITAGPAIRTYTPVATIRLPNGELAWTRTGYNYTELLTNDDSIEGKTYVINNEGLTGLFDLSTRIFESHDIQGAIKDALGQTGFSVNVDIQTGHMSQYVYINGTNPIIIWGDGYCSTTSGSHTYSTPGNYTIKIYSFRPTAMRFYSAAYTDNRVCKINNNIPWSTIQNVDWAFHNTNIVSIPASLFSACTSLESLQETFSGCHYLNEIPGTLFTGCVNIKWLNACFANCWSINNIPNNLFNALINVKDFYGCFYMTTHITSIPENLFSETRSAENFKWTFYGTPITSIPDTLFNQCNSANNFTECFKNCTSVIGAVPNLWESHPNATGTGCFTGLTRSNITNWYDIPVAWGGDPYFSIDVKTVSGHMTQYVYISAADTLIDWGDGTRDTTLNGINHTYANIGTYTVKICANTPTKLTFYSSTYTYNNVSKINNNLPWSTLKYLPFFLCGSKISSIPETLFYNCTSAENFNYAFNGCPIKEIPEDLFNTCRAATTFEGTFMHEGSLGSIPSNLINTTKCPSAYNFGYCFYNCKKVTGSVPELWTMYTGTNIHAVNCFGNMTKANITNWYDIPVAWGGDPYFSVDVNIDSTHMSQYVRISQSTSTYINWGDGSSSSNASGELIETHTYANTGTYTIKSYATNPKWISFSKDILDENNRVCVINNNIPWSSIESLMLCFARAYSLTSIPEHLLDNCTKLSNASNLFYLCRNITSIPPLLFDKCYDKLTNLDGTFMGMTSVTTIPDNLFIKCTKVERIVGIFNGCSYLTRIPDGLFDTMEDLRLATYAFIYCRGITYMPSNLFAANTKITSFYLAFESCIAYEGALPELWNTHPNADKTRCFYNCTKASNYQDALYAGWVLGNGFSVDVDIQSGHMSQYVFINGSKNIIDWGDGTARSSSSGNHTYTTPGIYTIRIFSEAPTVLRFYDTNGTYTDNRVCTINNNIPWSTITTLNYCFRKSIITSIPQGFLSNMTSLTSIVEVFSHCSLLTEIKSNVLLNTTNITNANYAFYNDNAITSNLPALWNTIPNASHTYTFYSCYNAPNYQDALDAGWICGDKFSVNVSITPDRKSQYISIKGGTMKTIDWADGSSDARMSGDLTTSHTYSSEGTYTIKIYSYDLTSIQFFEFGYIYNNVSAINNNLPWSTLESVEKCFRMSKLSSIPSALFSKCPNITNFNTCFYSSSSISGNLPELWTVYPTSSHAQCFTGCTQATNYTAAQEQGWA